MVNSYVRTPIELRGSIIGALHSGLQKQSICGVVIHSHHIYSYISLKAFPECESKFPWSAVVLRDVEHRES